MSEATEAAEPYRPLMVPTPVLSWLLTLDLSAEARTVVDSADWLEDRGTWALAATPEIADELGMAALRALDA